MKKVNVFHVHMVKHNRSELNIKVLFCSAGSRSAQKLDNV